MAFEPLCGSCCTPLSREAVVTSCLHLLCKNCFSQFCGRCLVCKEDCTTTGIADKNFPLSLKEKFVSNPLTLLSQTAAVLKFQLGCQADAQSQFKKHSKQQENEFNELKRKYDKLKTDYEEKDKACQQLKEKIERNVLQNHKYNDNIFDFGHCSSHKHSQASSINTPIISYHQWAGPSQSPVVNQCSTNIQHKVESALSGALFTPMADRFLVPMTPNWAQSRKQETVTTSALTPSQSSRNVVKVEDASLTPLQSKPPGGEEQTKPLLPDCSASGPNVIPSSSQPKSMNKNIILLQRKLLPD
jgi:hypothetical protein